MVSKIANGNMAHTAGIYADMSLDGPEIGTLVAVVDRARNLPNRKTMGKQNPYCAARLGKQAKKTETDMRGGQTPRWDQELRFTVHDSLDYKQLKVSVFNDDKRTDLIGETWVPLEKIIIPGGGQSDTWHSLSFKGRYSGEIRIELTYYDTRPKEEADTGVGEVRQAEEHVQAIGGPRQPHTFGQRSLPAYPASLPARANLQDLPKSIPYSTPHNSQFNGTPGTLPLNQLAHRYEPEQDIPGYETSPGDYASYTNDSSAFNSGPSGYMTQPNDYFPPTEYPQDDYAPDAPFPIRPAVTSHTYSDPASYQQHQMLGSIDLPELPPHQPKAIRPNPNPILQHDPYNASKQPGLTNPQMISGLNRSDRFSDQNHRHSLPRAAKSNPYQQAPRQRSFDDASERPLIQPEGLDTPPPPPVHRNGGGRVSAGLEYSDPPHWQNQPLVVTPAPLNIRGRKSASPSPLSNGYTMAADDYELSEAPKASRTSYQSAPTTATYPPLHLDPRRDRRQQGPNDAQSRPRSFVQTTPSSLIAGMNQSGVREDWERRASAIPSEYHITPPRRDRASMPDVDYDVASYSRTIHRSPSPQPQEQPQYSPTPYLDRREVPDQRQPKIHRKPPSAATLPRKSVSPQPTPTTQPQFSAFNPDSYDALNPNLANAKSINTSGPKYTTPEQIRQSAADLAKEQLLEVSGPIIGSDGRVIDPSDHLPSDTWAPEPEQKPPRKGPEVTFRFRPRDMLSRPRGSSGDAMAASRARETMIRPTALHSSPHAYGFDLDRNPNPSTISPTPASRNRLQKKVRLSPQHATSSPILPSTEYDYPAPRPSPSGPSHPLRERPNYGYAAPGYATRATTEPPPVLGKVPLGFGQEDWERDVMEEEMRRLQLGRGQAPRSRARFAR